MTIITFSDHSLETSWQTQLQNAVRDPAQLSDVLGIEVEDIDTGFPLLVPRSYLARIKPGDPDDPLLRQVLPTGAELLRQPGYSEDPVSEQSMNGPKGLIQKYRGRALIVTTGSCAVNCRYCFRRHYPYDSQRLSRDGWQSLYEHIRNDSSIQEVILSGGDPLMLNDRTLASVTQELEAIPHLTTIRFHTRLPVVIPDRICDTLLEWVEACNKQLVFVTHINHPNEIDESLNDALRLLKASGSTLLNQSVLLKNVNDDAETLSRLSRKLFNASVLPYYLHLLDPVQGAGHFDVDEKAGKHLIRELSSELPGYLVPKLAREVPHAPAKQVLIG